MGLEKSKYLSAFLSGLTVENAKISDDFFER